MVKTKDRTQPQDARLVRFRGWKEATGRWVEVMGGAQRLKTDACTPGKLRICVLFSALTSVTAYQLVAHCLLYARVLAAHKPLLLLLLYRVRTRIHSGCIVHFYHTSEWGRTGRTNPRETAKYRNRPTRNNRQVKSCQGGLERGRGRSHSLPRQYIKHTWFLVGVSSHVFGGFFPKGLLEETTCDLSLRHYLCARVYGFENRS